MASYKNSVIKINKCPACGFELRKRSNNIWTRSYLKKDTEKL